MVVNILLIACVGLGLIIVLRWPSSPVVVGYPLVWLIWSYYVPFLGGQPERFIALLGLFGVVILISRHISLPLPQPVVQVGFFLLILAQLVSAIVNSSSNIVEYMISLTTRILFMYMTYLLIRNQKQLRWMMTLYVFMGIIGVIAAVVANMVYGLGFFRTETELAFRQDISPLLRAFILNSNFSIVSAWLLLGVFPAMRNRTHRASILALTLLIFFGSFIAQFRREVLITIIIGLFFLLLYQPAKVQKQAFLLLFVSLGIFFFVLLPGSLVLQGRFINETPRLFTGSDTRLVSLNTALEMFKDRPILGWGPGSYRDISFRYLGPSSDIYVYGSFNAFAFIAVEGGIFSLIGLLILLFVPFQAAVRYRVETDDPAAWLLRCAPVLMVQIVIWFSFGNGWQLSMPWFWMGAILAAVRLSKIAQNKKVMVKI